MTTSEKFIAEHQGKYFCKCGCGKPIIIKYFHQYLGIPEYAIAHHPNTVAAKKKMIGENHPQWKGGKPKCFYCGKQLTNYDKSICRECFKKENFQGIESTKNIYKCEQCGRAFFSYQNKKQKVYCPPKFCSKKCLLVNWEQHRDPDPIVRNRARAFLHGLGISMKNVPLDYFIAVKKLFEKIKITENIRKEIADGNR